LSTSALVHDPLDRLGGGVSCGGGPDVDRYRTQAELARCHGAALAVAYLDNAIRTSNCGNRLQDTVFGDAVEERFVQVRVFAHIVLQISVQPHAVRAVSTGHDVENAFATRPTVACHTRGMPRTGMSTEVDADQVARASLFTPFVTDGA